MVAMVIARCTFTQSGINREYDWSGVATIHIYSISTVALNDYTRSGLSRYGSPTELQDTKQDLTLTKDRAFTFTIDKGNNDEQMGIKDAGKALSRQINEVIIPEVDKYRLSVMAAAATTAGGASAAQVIDDTNAYNALLLAGEYMSDYRNITKCCIRHTIRSNSKSNRCMMIICGTKFYNNSKECS